MFPISKYKFYVTSDNKTIAVTTYGGKTVRGVAKLDPRDEYDANLGKEIAAARCAVKVAKKRLKRAIHKEHEAELTSLAARNYVTEMTNYKEDAAKEYFEAINHLNVLKKRI